MVKLLHGDYKQKIVEIEDESVDLILTDIPFNISKANNFKTMKDRKGRNGIDFGSWDNNFCEQTMVCLIPKLKRGGSLVTFHSFEQHSKLIDIFSKHLILKDRFVWEKTNPMPRNRDRRYISNIEMCSWFVKEGEKWTFNRQNPNYDGCVLRYPSESGGGFKRYHPCQKNVKMLEELVRRHSNENDIVLDCFMGSGSTGIACLNTNRNFIGIEIDDTYFAVAKQRIEEVT